MNQSMWADPPAAPLVAPTRQTTQEPLQDRLEAPTELPAVEDFAQTGAQQDDLFDDVVPREESMRIRSDEDLFNDDFTPAPAPVVEQSVSDPMPAPAPIPSTSRGHGDNTRSRGGRGRGRGRGRGAHLTSNGEDQPEPQSQNGAPDNAPTGPRKETTFAVRGDRQATGGVRKPKLTEQELAEKLASMQIKNASIAAAHARAEADAASFAEREQQAKKVAEQKKKEERRDRQQMMGEREKNRQRKLNAMNGREWDAEKEEDDFRKGGRYDKRGGFGGDQENYTDGREYLYQEPKSGGRGRGGGSGRGGRGGRSNDQTAPTREDFPALPAKASTAAPRDDAATATGAVPDPSNGKSWADQVEASGTS